ncbi:MAG TPA: hypothetical protein VHN37_05315, partial [Actinomycetota bacterium]|nr:hypothetical protein [Actinomycetota bacterium]
MKETRRLRERALAAAVAWAIAGMAPAHAVPAPEREWSVAVQCFEVAAGGRSTVWGYAIAVGP